MAYLWVTLIKTNQLICGGKPKQDNQTKGEKNTRKRQSVKQNELETDSSDPSDDTFFIGQLGQLAGSQLVVTSGILVILS